MSADFRMTNAAFRVIIPNRHAVGAESNGLDTQHTAALKYIQSRASVTRKIVQEALGLKQTSAGILLKNLESRGLIEKTGSGKATVYSAKR